MLDKRQIGLLRKSAKKNTAGEKTEQELPLSWVGSLSTLPVDIATWRQSWRLVCGSTTSPRTEMDRWMDGSMDIWIDECTPFCTS
jgi:hypothetical protein